MTKAKAGAARPPKARKSASTVGDRIVENLHAYRTSIAPLQMVGTGIGAGVGEFGGDLGLGTAGGYAAGTMASMLNRRGSEAFTRMNRDLYLPGRTLAALPGFVAAKSRATAAFAKALEERGPDPSTGEYRLSMLTPGQNTAISAPVWAGGLGLGYGAMKDIDDYIKHARSRKRRRGGARAPRRATRKGVKRASQASRRRKRVRR